MNTNYSNHLDEMSKRKSAFTQLRSAFLSPKFLIYSAIILVLLLISAISKSQTYPASFSQVLVTNGVSAPTNMEFAPDGRIFVAQQNGQLRVIKNGILLTKPFISLNVSWTGERGLLGVAFDPAFNMNHFIYLYYTILSGANNRLSRFTASGDTVVPGSEVVLLDFSPLSSATNHNGGTIHFGPDGKLYVALGDNANNNNSQSLNTYLGKLLRINSDGSVPSGNPFTTGGAQQMRIWSYGLRNPYTFSFQPGTGKLFINDVGENSWEEINEATTSGLNYGWSTAEGNSTNAAFTNPVYTYAHGTNNGCAITGGTFFNPSTTHYPSTYIGKYFYVDYCGKWIDMLTYNGSAWSRSGFATNISGHPIAMSVGPDGNLYYLSRDNNALYKIVYTSTNTLEPLDDAYVVSGTNANNNYGTSNLLIARKASTTSNKDEQIYLRFSLLNTGTTISTAKLRLYGAMNASTPSVNIDVRYLGNLNWQENTLTYSNKPPPQSPIYTTKTISGTTAQYYEWDLTSLIQTRKNAGATQISFVLRGNAKIENFAKFNSKEAASNKPQLLITSSSDLAANENDNQKTVSEFNGNGFIDNEISVFPNPAADQFTIHSNIEKENSTLKIVDMNGIICMNELIKPGENILSAKFLSNGIYILAVETKEGIIRKKLQIIK